MKQVLLLFMIATLNLSSINVNISDDVKPHFSYMLGKTEVKSDDYPKAFRVTAGLLSVKMEVDGHLVSVMLKDYKGVGVYEPLLMSYKFEDGPDHYSSLKSGVFEVTVDDGKHIEGVFKSDFMNLETLSMKVITKGSFYLMLK